MDPRQQAFFKQLFVGSLLIICFFSMSQRAIAKSGLSERNDVQTFISEMTTKHQYDKQTLIDLFEETEIKPYVIDAMKRPYEAKPWHKYRKIFVNSSRINSGVKFYQEHEETLKRAEREYGVPADIITAIIGVETRYGSNKGTIPVLASLATLAFDYPPRASFFRSELEQFLLLTREQGFEPLEIKGSYAGAMGGPQFISSSYRHYAIDFSGDGKADLLNNWEDIIGSVANYFHKHGWRSQQAVILPATVNEVSRIESVLAKRNSPKTSHSIAEFKKLGVELDSSVRDDQPAALIALEESNDNSYWVGLNNFYVITRYNHSNLYAMAVYQLSQEIQAARQSS